MKVHRSVPVRHRDAGLGTCRHCGQPCRPGVQAHTDCKAKYTARRDYGRSIRGPQICTDRARGGCRGDLERDHVVELVRGGPHDWVVWRCQEHHTEKTRNAMSSRTTTAPSAARAGARKAPPTPSSPDRPWTVPVATTGLVVSAVWILYGPTSAMLAATGACALAAVILVVRWRARARRRALGRARMVCARALGIDPADTRIRARGWVGPWRARMPLPVEVRYPEWVRDEDPQVREAMVSACASKWGADLVGDWTPERDTVTLRGRTPDDTGTAAPPGPPPPRAPEVGDLAIAVRAFMRADSATVTLDSSDDVGPTRLTVRYPPTFRDDQDDTRAGLQAVITAKTPGRWRPTWDTERNVAVFDRRPPMPDVVRLPSTPPADPRVLLLGVDEHTDPVPWDMRVAPHILIAGETGSGKTCCIRSLVVQAAQAGWEVRICDPKRIEMFGLRNWPGVARVAADVEDMVDLVESAAAEMERRYRSIEAGRATTDTMPPLMVVVDEAREFIDRANVLFRAETKRSAGEHPVIDELRSLLRMGRSARIHVVVGIQRPDAKVIGGEARDNFGARVALGAVSEQGARMMFGDSSVGRDVPAGAKGRATVDVGHGPTEIQTFLTPDPGARDLTPEEELFLASLRGGSAALRALPPAPLGAADNVEPAPNPGQSPAVAEALAVGAGDIEDPAGDPAGDAPEPPAPVRVCELSQGDMVLWAGARHVVDGTSQGSDEDHVLVTWHRPRQARVSVELDADQWLHRDPTAE